MVLETEKPNFLDASCCKVDVVKGGVGFFSVGFSVTEITLYFELKNSFIKDSKFSSLIIFLEYFALKILPLTVLKKADILNDSLGTCSFISFSLSAINLRATD